MLDENDVIGALAEYLKRDGYDVLKQLHTTEKGVDLIARRGKLGPFLHVEAKGGTSSRQGSNRFGKPYTQSQVFDRVSKGFYTAVLLRSKNPLPDEVGLAVPDTPCFRDYLVPIVDIANILRIQIFVVRSKHEVFILNSAR
jgi:hypothetical protein